MFKSTGRTLGVLGGVVGLILLVSGIALSTGVVKLTGSAGSVAADAATSATTALPVDTIPAPVSEAPATTAAPPPRTVASIAVVRTPSTKAPAAAVEAPAESAPIVAAPVAPVPTVPALAARTVPSAGQVQAAIQGITSMVQLPMFVSITPANVADVGNRVCTAFDQGQTYQQVKATGLAMVTAYVPVSDAAADYAVRTAVQLYCPGYASKLP